MALPAQPPQSHDERPTVGKTFRITNSQDQFLTAFLREEEESFPTLALLLDTALAEFFQRRRKQYPATRFRRPY